MDLELIDIKINLFLISVILTFFMGVLKSCQ